MSQSSKIPVCITVAPDRLARLDQVAAELDRSRSWLAGYAIEEFLSRSDGTAVTHGAHPSEPTPLGGRHGRSTMPGTPLAAAGPGDASGARPGGDFTQSASAILVATHDPLRPSGAPGGAGGQGPSSSAMAPAGRSFSKGSAMSDLHRDVLERQAAIARERAAQEQRAIEDVRKRNVEYLECLDSGDNQ